MKNWFVPVTVLGLSGLGLMCATEKGRERLRGFYDRMAEHGDPLAEFGKFVEDQLDTIQQNLDRLSEALEARQA